MPLIVDEIINLVDIGSCKNCDQKYLRCHACGTFINVSKNQSSCLCEEKKYFIMDEENHIVFSLKEFEFENPTQLEIFE